MASTIRPTQRARMIGATVCVTIIGWLLTVEALLDEIWPRSRQ